MLTQTIVEALRNETQTSYYGNLYVYRNGDDVLYVGISQDVHFRMLQHMGVASAHSYRMEAGTVARYIEEGKGRIIIEDGIFNGSPIGELILYNTPESAHWQFDVYGWEDLLSFAREHTPHLKGIIEQLEKQREYFAYDASKMLEVDIINHLQACLNGTGNFHNRQIADSYKTRYSHIVSGDGSGRYL